ncbi:restriction endonuclease subunit S [Patescibacteria group bacterium]|nr:restriction endonuclease subunit S [Patescibacteria group bacterium]
MKTKISNFLKERQDRFKPEEAKKLNLKRIEKITQNGEIFISDKPSNTNMILVKPGDLVLSGIGIAKGGGNSLNIYEGDENVLTTIHYSSYELDRSKISEAFLKIFLISPYFRKLLKENSPNGIKAEIKPKHFLHIELELPSIEKQKEIVQKIQSIEKEIKQLENKSSQDKSLLTSLRQSILQEAVQGKLVLQDPKDELAKELLKKIKAEKEKLIKEGKIKKGKELPPIEEDEVPYELPKGWGWCRLGEVCEKIHYGYTASAIKNSNGIKLLRITDIQNNKVNWEQVPSCQIKESEIDKYLLNENDILIARTGGTIGKSYLVKDVKFKSVFASYLIRAVPFKEINQDYIKLFLGSRLYWDQLFEGSMGTGQPNVNGVTLSKLKFPLPPLPEQKKIVEKVNALIKMCDELELRIKENNENSERLMGAVLKEVFEN